jgi:hypothetical protein
MLKNRLTRGSGEGNTQRKSCAKYSRSKKIQYKACRLSDYSLKLTPLLVLSGVWFQQAGFWIGDVVNIEVSEGKIIISNPLPF